MCMLRHLTRKVEGHEHKLHTDNLFFYFLTCPILQNLTKRKIYCCRKVRPNKEGKPLDKCLKLHGDCVEEQLNVGANMSQQILF
jgi:hypothetical protein